MFLSPFLKYIVPPSIFVKIAAITARDFTVSLQSMSPATYSVSSITTRAAATVNGETHDCRHSSAKSVLTCPRSKSAHNEAIATKHKIVVFLRNSLVSNTSICMHDLEINAIYDIDHSVTTLRTFAQDDCLYSERAPFRSPYQGSSRLGRARYNFQQGLVNTKEVLETKRCHGNASYKSV